MIKTIIFDKDGTLFDFQATWGHWASSVLDQLCDGDVVLRAKLARSVDYDDVAKTFAPGSVAIAGTPLEIATALVRHLPDRTALSLLQEMNQLAATAPQIEVTPLGAFFGALKDRGIKIGVMTNDSEVPAKAHLADYLDQIDMVVGSDSGFGAKPDPDPLLAIAQRFGVGPSHCVMVGDSTHDLQAGRAAGMGTIAVLTGLAGQSDLAPFADAVLPDISHISPWIDAKQK